MAQCGEKRMIQLKNNSFLSFILRVS